LHNSFPALLHSYLQLQVEILFIEPFAGGYQIYPVKQNFSPGCNFFFRPKKHQFRNLKNHQKFNCGCISKKLRHVIDKHVSFHLIHKNLTLNIEVKRSRGQGHKDKKITKLAIEKMRVHFSSINLTRLAATKLGKSRILTL
jgi:hypothetical protein